MEDWLYKDDVCPNQGNHYWVDQYKHYQKVEIPYFNTWLYAIQKSNRFAEYKTPPNEIKLFLNCSKTARDIQNLPNPFTTTISPIPVLSTTTLLPLLISSTNPTKLLMGIMQQYMIFKMA